VAGSLGFSVFALGILQRLKRQRPRSFTHLACTTATYAISLELAFLGLPRHLVNNKVNKNNGEQWG
jgi:hypothetical protein